MTDGERYYSNRYLGTSIRYRGRLSKDKAIEYYSKKLNQIWADLKKKGKL